MSSFWTKIGNDISELFSKEEKKRATQHNQKATPGKLTSQSTITSTTSSRSSNNIPISDVTGNRGLVSQKPNTRGIGSDAGSSSGGKTPHIPISVVTGSRDITTVDAKLREYLQAGSPSASSAIPKQYANLANLLDKVTSDIRFDDWANLTPKQQQKTLQNSGLTNQEQWDLLNAAPNYIETIAKVKDLFANRYTLGLTVTNARNLAKELFTIADERDQALNRTGKYANDAVFAPKALRWLDEREQKLLSQHKEETSDVGQETMYNGSNPDLAARAARRASYKEIDHPAATKQIEKCSHRI